MKEYIQKNWWKFALVVILVFSYPVAERIANAAQNRHTQSDASNATRAGTPAVGNVQKITTSTGVSAAFTVLNRNSVYLLRCTTDTYVATGTSSPTATNSNFPVPPSIFPILTTDTVIYVAGLARSTGGTCWIWEYN
jgi:hypothetical protein